MSARHFFLRIKRGAGVHTYRNSGGVSGNMRITNLSDKDTNIISNLKRAVLNMITRSILEKRPYKKVC